jgi:large subunit ribosomal protein L7/L12
MEDLQIMASEKVLKLMEEIKAMTVLELSEMVKALEEEFGVSAAAPVMMGGPVAAAPAAAVEEKTEFDVELAAIGAKKLDVIKVWRELTGAGLVEAKNLIEEAAAAPKVLKEGLSKADAEAYKEKLVAAGATVNIK